MTKRYDEPIEVTPDPAQGGAPVGFSWRGRRYEVDQWLGSWREAGEWWRRSRNGNDSKGFGGDNGEVRASASDGHSAGGPKEREYWRVVARPSGTLATGDLDADGFMRPAGAVYDVYLDRIKHEWRLARLWD